MVPPHRLCLQPEASVSRTRATNDRSDLGPGPVLGPKKEGCPPAQGVVTGALHSWIPRLPLTSNINQKPLGSAIRRETRENGRDRSTTRAGIRNLGFASALVGRAADGMAWQSRVEQSRAEQSRAWHGIPAACVREPSWEKEAARDSLETKYSLPRDCMEGAESLTDSHGHPGLLPGCMFPGASSSVHPQTVGPKQPRTPVWLGTRTAYQATRFSCATNMENYEMPCTNRQGPEEAP
ncbi:unnamed protein product [Diplocarpon coronariae]